MTDGLALFGWGFDPQICLSARGQGPYLTPFVRYTCCDKCTVKWYVNPSNGLSRVYECDRQTDRPRYGETRNVYDIGAIACAAWAIVPNNAMTLVARHLSDKR